MTGRRSVWSDPRVIELSEKFVPTADEVWRLQNGSDPECVFFQKMAEHGHYGGRPGKTRQGIYVCTPGGEFLASINSTRAERVLEMMRRGLKAWDNLPENERHLVSSAEGKPRHRWVDSFPADGLILNVFTRDLPLECDPDLPEAVRWNQDFAWFSKDEARQWIPKNPHVGNEYQVPERQVTRLARLHLVDTVKGQTSRFRPDEVTGSSISATVVERSGPRVKIRISGSTTGSSLQRRGGRDSAHGVVTRLFGRATYDLDQAKFVEFEVVALGRRWGRTRFNGRHRDAGTGPLGFVFRLAAPGAPRIAPAFIHSYDAEWLKHPRRR